MYIEITKGAFEAMVPLGMPSTEVKRDERHGRVYYYSHGVKLQIVCTFSEATRQYYIQDINA